MKTLLDAECLVRILARLRGLSPDARARWGRLTAPRMLVHLSDQVRSTLGDVRVAPIPGVLRWPLVRQAVMYWLPWPKEKIKGPPEMFLTPPTAWSADLATFEALLDRFVHDTRAVWPDHPFFGPMTHRSWGRFCHRHIDYHLRQFGA
jgi:hypothetical protein